MSSIHFIKAIYQSSMAWNSFDAQYLPDITFSNPHLLLFTLFSFFFAAEPKQRLASKTAALWGQTNDPACVLLAHNNARVCLWLITIFILKFQQTNLGGL